MAHEAEQSDDNPALRITALSVADLAAVLRKSGAKYADEAAISGDIASGAPTNADKTVNLVHYAAWLVKEMGHGRH